MNLAELRKTLAEGATIHNEQAVLRREAIHDRRFHRCRAGSSQIHRTRRIGRTDELFQQAVGIEHELGKFRRPNTRNECA